MPSEICPFLGLQEDPSTSLSFPSEGNFCHHAVPVSRVRKNHQQNFCLTGEHSQCPVYRAMQPVPLPADLLAAPLAKASTRSMLVTLGIPALVVSAAALAFAWNSFGATLGASANNIPITSLNSDAPGALSMLNATPTPKNSPTGTTPENPQIANCPLPAGYIAYTVNPTDSLYRLSVVYGVSVEELQKVNCMGTNTVLLPSQVIYVPDLPTSTPTPTNTLYAVGPTAQQAFSNNQPAPSNTPLPPNTPVPPTNPPPVVIPTQQATNPPPVMRPTKEPPHPKIVKPTKEPKTKPGGGGDHKKPKKKK